LDAGQKPDERTRRIRAALEEIEARRHRILKLLQRGIPMGDAERLADALSLFSEAYGRFAAVAHEVLPGWDYSPPAVLRHHVRGPGSPRKMAADYAALADAQSYAASMGLHTTVEHEDFSTYLTVRGPRCALAEVARYADEELDRLVEIEEDRDEAEEAP